jgi:hypothetical protein
MPEVDAFVGGVGTRVYYRRGPGGARRRAGVPVHDARARGRPAGRGAARPGRARRRRVPWKRAKQAGAVTWHRGETGTVETSAAARAGWEEDAEWTRAMDEGWSHAAVTAVVGGAAASLGDGRRARGAAATAPSRPRRPQPCGAARPPAAC